MKPKTSIAKISEYMQREANIKGIMRVVSYRKNIIDITIGILSLLSLLINYIEVYLNRPNNISQCFTFENQLDDKMTVYNALRASGVLGLRIFLLLLTVLGLPFIYWSTILQVKMLFIYDKNQQGAGIYEAGLLWQLLAEMLIFSINPPILADAIFSLSNRSGPVVKGVTQSTAANYSIDVILNTLAIAKTWFLIKLLPLVTSVTADNSRKINEIKGLIPDF